MVGAVPYAPGQMPFAPQQMGAWPVQPLAGNGTLPGAPATGGGLFSGLPPPPKAPGMPNEKMIPREAPQPPEPRRELVAKIQRMVEQDKAHWKKSYERMRQDMQFARHGAKKSWVRANRYVANMTQRHIAQRTAALYAKNPRFVVRAREKQYFALWDGTAQSLMQAMQAMSNIMATGIDPNAMALLQDFQQGTAQRTLIEKTSRTLELVLTHQFDDQEIDFKTQMKQLVRRALTCGVAYIKIGYERVMEKRPETMSRLNALETRLGTIRRLMADLADKEVSDSSPEVEQLRLDIQALNSEPEVIAREGLVFDFPRSTAIIPDKSCYQLKNFLGCDHVTEEFLMTADEIKETWDIDIKSAAGAGVSTSGRKNMGPPVDWDGGKGKSGDQQTACVWQTYMRKEGLVYLTIQGYPDFVEEPAQPPLLIERFWPWFPLMFNEVEDPDDIYPPSDVRLLVPMQEDHNRAREAMRQVRRANLPKYITRKGALTKQDVNLLKSAPENAVMELDGLAPNQKVDDLLQPMKFAPIDPAVYDTRTSFEDILRVLGTQEANLGGTSNSTATESSIAESSRMSALASNVDDLDDLLTDVAVAGSQIVVREMDAGTVGKIVGPGASWPTLQADQIIHDLLMEVQAGSSGRPNKMQEIQNFERLAPFLMQVPGMSPQWLLQQAVTRLDDRIDPSAAIAAGMPSITAMNAQKQLTQGPPSADPNAQGPQGQANTAQPREPQPQAPPPPQAPEMVGGAEPPKTFVRTPQMPSG